MRQWTQPGFASRNLESGPARRRHRTARVRRPGGRPRDLRGNRHHLRGHRPIRDLLRPSPSDPLHGNDEVRREFSIVLTGRPVSGHPTTSTESHEVRWVPPGNLFSYPMDQSMRRRIDDYLSGTGTPIISQQARPCGRISLAPGRPRTCSRCSKNPLDLSPFTESNRRPSPYHRTCQPSAELHRFRDDGLSRHVFAYVERSGPR